MTNALMRARLTGAVAVTPRSLPAYRDMFQLTDADLLAGPILDCPAGASPFGARVRARGGEVVSVDPAYAAPAAVVARAAADIGRVHGLAARPPGRVQLGLPRLARCDGAHVASGAGRVRHRLRRRRRPLRRRPAAPAAVPGRAVRACALRVLLFVYPELFGPAELLAALRELARVTRGEVRVYPLTTSAGEPYAELPALCAASAAHGVDTEIRRTGCTYATTPDSDRTLVCRAKEAR